MAKPVRRNIAHLAPSEIEHLVDVIRQVDLLAYSDGVSYWDKQDQIHQHTHNHGGNSFIPWHRELVNRFEALLQQVDPDIALHYWDWTDDPRAAADGNGGTVDLLTDQFFGTANGLVDGPLASLHNGDVLAGSREDTGSWTDPPRAIERFCVAGAPGVASDTAILGSTTGVAQAHQWTTVRGEIEGSHNTAHLFFGIGSDIRDGHQAFEDPFVFLLHANVDRLFAMWQTEPGQEWRLDPDLVFGDQSNTNDVEGILHNLQPWDGTVEIGAPLPPWTGGSSAIEVKNCRHPSVVTPPCYDTLPVTVTQAAPLAGQPVRFLDAVEHVQTARALHLTVRACIPVTAAAAVTGPFTLLDASVQSDPADGFTTSELLIWVLHTPDAAGTTASGTLTVDIAETGDHFEVPIEANAIAKPTVGTSLVLDRSGSMDLPSGVAAKKRIDVLHEAAPLFVHLLGDSDGVGVVAFDTDAAELEPVQDAGGLIGGVGRADALAAIGLHATNPFGLTAIGDGIEAAASQLAAVSGDYEHGATIVFTDGHETAAKTIAEVAPSITSRVFAIGLGTAEALNPGALSDIAASTGGYLLLTGNPGPDDTILLQKYFAQVLAGATNNVIIVDPDGFVPIGGVETVPFPVSAADRRLDVVVLSEAAPTITVSLEAPDGTEFPAAGGTEIVDDNSRLLRVDLAGLADPASIAGTWHVHLKIDKRRLRRWIKRLEELGRKADLVRLDTHGVPYTLTVQGQSSLRLSVRVNQPSRRPGALAQATATLTHSSIPLSHSATVDAIVTRPDGSVWTERMTQAGDGVFTVPVPTEIPGVHRLLARASGADLAGQRFTREELRTIPVWSRGDDPAPPLEQPGDGADRLDWCQLLSCWLHDATVARALRAHDIDPKKLASCLDEACRE